MRSPHPLRCLSLAAAFSAACGGDATAPDAPGGSPPVDTTSSLRNVAGTATVTLTVDGLPREFVVHVGSSTPSTSAVPVVFMLHGTSGNGQEFLEGSRWREKADTVGFIAVFPSALTYCFRDDDNFDGDVTDVGELKATTKWSQGALGTSIMPLCSDAEVAALSAGLRARATHPLVSDVAFLDRIVEWLKANRRIDEKRIYASGFSNGAEMVQRLMVERNTVFAALHSHAGGLRLTPQPGRAISVLSSLGNRDDRFTPFFGVPFFPINELTMTSPGFRTLTSSKPLAQLQLGEPYTYSESLVNGKRIGRWMHRTSLVGASNTFEFALFEDLGHAYPANNGYPITIVDLVWPFFASQRLP